MKIGNIKAVVFRIIRQLEHDKRTLALLFIVPIVILSLLGYLIKGAENNLSLDIVNNDQGEISNTLLSTLSTNQNLKIKFTDNNTAEKDLHNGIIQGYVLIPSNFTLNILRQTPVSPSIYLEGSEPSESQAIKNLFTHMFDSTNNLGQNNITLQIKYLYGGSSLNTLDYFGGGFIGIVVFFLIYVITSVSFLRERSQGTLERLMSYPLTKLDIIAGYTIGFTILALIQAVEVLLFSLYVLNIHNIGNILLILLIEILLVFVAVNIGIFFSTFSKTEFQAVQFIPLVIVPQILLSGIMFPINTEPTILQALSNILPLTYAVNALRDIMIKGYSLNSTHIQLDILVLLFFALLAFLGAGIVLKRRIA